MARSAGDRQLELEATRVRMIVMSETGLATAEVLGELASIAGELGRWPLVVTSLIGQMNLMSEGRSAEAAQIADEADRLAEAHGLTESKAWIAFNRAELDLQEGDWDAALRSGGRALALAEEHGYSRAAVRTWFTLRPIARYRGDRELLARAGEWFDALASVPDSPYGRLMHAAIDLDVAWVRGTAAVPVAPDRLVEAWLEAGLFQDIGSATSTLGESLTDTSSQLSKGDHRLWSARLALHEDGIDRAKVEAMARDALERLRLSSACWWVVQAIELLTVIGAASVAERAEHDVLAERLRGVDEGASPVQGRRVRAD